MKTKQDAFLKELKEEGVVCRWTGISQERASSPTQRTVSHETQQHSSHELSHRRTKQII